MHRRTFQTVLAKASEVKLVYGENQRIEFR